MEEKKSNNKMQEILLNGNSVFSISAVIIAPKWLFRLLRSGHVTFVKHFAVDEKFRTRHFRMFLQIFNQLEGGAQVCDLIEDDFQWLQVRWAVQFVEVFEQFLVEASDPNRLGNAPTEDDRIKWSTSQLFVILRHLANFVLNRQLKKYSGNKNKTKINFISSTC